MRRDAREGDVVTFILRRIPPRERNSDGSLTQQRYSAYTVSHFTLYRVFPVSPSFPVTLASVDVECHGREDGYPLFLSARTELHHGNGNIYE